MLTIMYWCKRIAVQICILHPQMTVSLLPMTAGYIPIVCAVLYSVANFVLPKCGV